MINQDAATAAGTRSDGRGPSMAVVAIKINLPTQALTLNTQVVGNREHTRDLVRSHIR